MPSRLAPPPNFTPLFADGPVPYSTMPPELADNPYTPGHWSQNIVVRIMVGLLVSLGVSVMLYKAAELIIVNFTPVEPYWKTLTGFITLQAVQMAGVFFGAMLACAGRNDMLTLGVLIGISMGFLSMIFLPTHGAVPTTLYFIMPAWFVVASGIGGWLGEFYWHPLDRRERRIISTSKLTEDRADMSMMQIVRKALLGMIFANIYWIRVFFAVICIIPTLWLTHDFVKWCLLNFGLTAWSMEIGLQKVWVEVMIKVLMVFICAAVAGAGTTHGIAHGFWVGVICTVINLLMHVFIPKENPWTVDQILLELGWVFVLSIMAGGFGALVIPPMIYLAQRRRPNVK
jgi:hypothetical protein